MDLVNDTAANDVAHLLHQLEAAIDDAYAVAGRLAAALPRARSEQRLSAVVGQPIFTHLAHTINAIGEARGHAVASHRLLDAVRRAERIEVRAWGDEKPKPPIPMVAADASHLSVVA